MSDFAAGQYVISYRDFLELTRFDHPLVDALKSSADDQGAGSRGERLDP